MKTCSAGLLVYRLKGGLPEVFIVHNGGPYWAKKDDGVWSLPKGEINQGEDPLAAAQREFNEETGFAVPQGPYYDLGEVSYPKGGKTVQAWAVEGDLKADDLKSNHFQLEWPPRSGKIQSFPEIDRGGWFSLPEASKKLFAPNVAFLERLANLLHVPFGADQLPEPPAQSELF
jgi:predicted NUDIX family NTP pyrophosphohydrolase